MTPLAERIVRQIEANGPIGIADYMALCLFDPQHGYYTTREPFGREGDFTTAPEISQMFGEIVGIWLYAAWDALGRPMPVTVAEIGPGRGTLMKDLLRTLARLDAAFVTEAAFALVEASPRLAAVQRQTLGQAPAPITWHDRLDTLPQAPLLIVANELFDALPIRQYVKTVMGWRERVIGLGEDRQLQVMAGPGSADASLLPAGALSAPVGAIVELAPARQALMEEIAYRIAAFDGAGLFFDYGYIAGGVGDTLQAMRAHAYDHVLANPGQADLTAHVDFAALCAVARSQGLDAQTMAQGQFLLAMGLAERAGRLGVGKGAAEHERLRGEVERLAAPQAMGELFKVLAVCREGVALPPFLLAE